MSIESLVGESDKLAKLLDPIVEDIADIRLQGIADSAWHRLSVVNASVRDAGGGALAATLARGLVEQAAYWDWALATGVGVDHLDQWAALELERLRGLARDADDEVWLGWLLPPDASISAVAGPAIPENAGDAVRRIGSGLDGAVLSPLGFAGLLSAYRVLDVLAHNNYLGAVILAEQLDLELPDRLAAITTHLAAAGATAVTFALADDGSCLDAATAQFETVAQHASEIHGLSAQTARPQRRLPHSRQTRPMTAVSSISRMPAATPDMTELGLTFLAATDQLVSVVASEQIEAEDFCEWIAHQSFRLSLSSLLITRGALDGRLGKALLSEPVRRRLGASDLRRAVTVRARHANLDPASQARHVPVGVRARLRDRDGGHGSRIRTHRVDHAPTGRTRPRFHPRAPTRGPATLRRHHVCSCHLPLPRIATRQPRWRRTPHPTHNQHQAEQALRTRLSRSSPPGPAGSRWVVDRR